jgi:hypothetical protein
VDITVVMKNRMKPLRDVRFSTLNGIYIESI